MVQKKFFIIVIFILLVSITINTYQYIINQQAGKSLSNDTAKVYVEEMNNIKVSVSKITHIKDVIELVVDVNGLEKDKTYTISLESDNGSSGVLLSEGNTLIRVGELENETQFIPYDSNLNFWTTHPERVLNDSTMHIRIADELEKEVFEMEI